MAWPFLIAMFCFTPQTAPGPPAFAVASIKLNTSGHNGIGNKFGPDSMRWTSTPLRTLIETAHRLMPYQLLGGPAWIASDTWDIDAKSEGQSTFEQKRAMLATSWPTVFTSRLTARPENCRYTGSRSPREAQSWRRPSRRGPSTGTARMSTGDCSTCAAPICRTWSSGFRRN